VTQNARAIRRANTSVHVVLDVRKADHVEPGSLLSACYGLLRVSIATEARHFDVTINWC
jgi:hypothetical protein